MNEYFPDIALAFKSIGMLKGNGELASRSPRYCSCGLDRRTELSLSLLLLLLLLLLLFI